MLEKTPGWIWSQAKFSYIHTYTNIELYVLKTQTHKKTKFNNNKNGNWISLSDSIIARNFHIDWCVIVDTNLDWAECELL